MPPTTATQQQPSPAGQETASASPPAPHLRPLNPYRDLIEQIVIAFLLAFVVRGFQAEAFVIPTGSMAPTLMGMHKDTNCPHCGFGFAVNASEEFEHRADWQGRPFTVASGVCSNCRLPVALGDQPSFNGDRILVMKFLYNLPWVSDDQPTRWEVVVFHYPEEPEVNYIKRLVGMPNDHLRIMFGDVLRKQLGSDAPFQLLRKPLPHLLAMLQNVYSDNHRPSELARMPEWKRWTPSRAGAWLEPRDAVYTSEASEGEEWATLRYRHLIPDPVQARELLKGESTEPFPRLISDYCAYNSGSTSNQRTADPIQPHWVGDLAITFRAENKQASGALRVTLIEGGTAYDCEIDLATGKARLLRDGEPLAEPVATAFQSPGSHEVRFANVDGRLTLWVDSATPFGDGVIVQDQESEYTPPTSEDLEPVRIAARGPSVTVSDLVLARDIYYTITPNDWDYEGLGLFRNSTLSDPREFPLIANVRPREYPIQPNHYMMLGDNSPRSKDGRGWTTNDAVWDTEGDRQAWEVPADLLIGKAFFVYWPHGKPFPIHVAINKNLRVPFYPNVARMKWIR